MNRFAVDTTSTINHWGDPGISPPPATVNISYGTKWALGIEGNQVSDTDKRLHLGYYEVRYMGLTGRELESEEPNEERSFAMHHTYEISLVPPGEDLLDICEETHPLHCNKQGRDRYPFHDN